MFEFLRVAVSKDQRQLTFVIPEGADNPAPESMMIFFAELKTALKSSIEDEGGMSTDRH